MATDESPGPPIKLTPEQELRYRVSGMIRRMYSKELKEYGDKHGYPDRSLEGEDEIIRVVTEFAQQDHGEEETWTNTKQR